MLAVSPPKPDVYFILDSLLCLSVLDFVLSVNLLMVFLKAPSESLSALLYAVIAF
uniref:Uncharacterized protein n=1 Tax=uncultured marine virus TaxID=186617 RepID=A0A0F7L5A6_9VIRU|nr:hypothetical protein [uncultured marine virus]